MVHQNEIVFVFIGTSLPKYVEPSLKLAVKNSELSIRLIGRSDFKKIATRAGAKFTSIEDFYRPSEFEESSKNIILPHNFRNGFWLKTLERFFVLKQFMQVTDKTSIFHAELDQLLFNCSKLFQYLENSEDKGLFLPFHTPDKAVASIFYCNKIEFLENFLNFSNRNESFQNEMEMLAKWGKKNLDKIFLLPTIATELVGNLVFEAQGFNVLKSSKVGGIVDAAQLGQWVGGEDPRNLSFRMTPTNHYVENDLTGILSEEQLKNLKFNLSKDFVLTCVSESYQTFNIFNLHLHSKIHAWINKDVSNLETLIKYANNKKSSNLPTTRKIQIISILTTALKSFLNNPLDVLNRRITNFFNSN